MISDYHQTHGRPFNGRDIRVGTRVQVRRASPLGTYSAVGARQARRPCCSHRRARCVVHIVLLCLFGCARGAVSARSRYGARHLPNVISPCAPHSRLPATVPMHARWSLRNGNVISTLFPVGGDPRTSRRRVPSGRTGSLIAVIAIAKGPNGARAQAAAQQQEAAERCLYAASMPSRTIP